MEHIDLTTSDDITDFNDQEKVTVKKINLEFRQESKLKGIVREFTIFNDNQCYQRVIRKHGGKHKFRVNLAYLNAKPKRDFILADKWLITTAISFILSFLLVYTGWFSKIQFSKSGVMMMTTLSISFCLISFLIALLRTNDRVLFYSQFGNIPILEFTNKNPDSRSFLSFIKTLRKHIVQSQAVSRLNTKEQLTLELKELRRLKNESVISVSLYERAKKRIFSHKAFK